jgi:DNA-binding response OmpR family regulator
MDNNNPAGKAPLILIVEDDPALSKLYDEKFKKEGFNTMVARDGKSGLNMALTQNPNLILLDMLLPHLNGLDVLGKVMEDENGKKIPVIILTNIAEREEADKALKMGAKEYLAKAMHDPSDIVERVRKHLGMPSPTAA